jgi:outer membrane protein TolC
MRITIVLGLICLFQAQLFAQPASEDTSSQLYFDQYIQWVADFHPVARQIGLMDNEARAKLRKARGAFDPKLYGSYDDKLFGETNYWDIFEAGVKIPTRTGIEVKAAFNAIEGDFVNPKDKLPKQGQAVLGVSVPLLRGLRIDARRASLQQAQVMLEQTAIEQQLAYNELIYEASLTYWDWVVQYAARQLFDESAQRAATRFEATRQAFLAGDEAAIDTTDALTQYQSIQLLLLEADNAYLNASISLSNFLWSENGLPLSLRNEVRPPALEAQETPLAFSSSDLEQLLAQIEQHPMMLQNAFKLETLGIERKLKGEMLKPQLDINYNILSSNDAFEQGFTHTEFAPTQNYKWGFEVGFPIFLRKERGDLAITDVKIQQTRLERDRKRLEVENKLLYYQASSQALQAQITLQQAAVENYIRLLEAEEEKRQNGQSTLFLINSREMKLIAARQKLLSLQAKYAKVQASWTFAAASLQMP